MIHDHVPAGSPILTTPKCDASATRKRSSEMTHTANVGAFPELRIFASMVGDEEWSNLTLARWNSVSLFELYELLVRNQHLKRSALCCASGSATLHPAATNATLVAGPIMANCFFRR